jgi:hypothetical protein
VGNAEAQAEYDKLAGLLEELSKSCERNKISDEAKSAPDREHRRSPEQSGRQSAR